LALQAGQVAQVALFSAQHFMPQSACLLEDIPQQAQPLNREMVQASTA
jgi:hypothetical protein